MKKRNLIFYQVLESFIYYIIMSNILTLLYVENFIKPTLESQESGISQYLEIYKSDTSIDFLFSLSFKEVMICLFILYLLRFIYGFSKMFLFNMNCVGTFKLNEKLYFKNKLSKMKYTLLKPFGIINLIWLLNDNYRNKLGIFIEDDMSNKDESEKSIEIREEIKIDE